MSDIPGVGRLFARTQRTTTQTDIVLTLTPHIIRVLDLDEADLRAFRAGRDSLIPLPELPLPSNRRHWTQGSRNRQLRNRQPRSRFSSRILSDPFHLPAERPQPFDQPAVAPFHRLERRHAAHTFPRQSRGNERHA